MREYLTKEVAAKRSGRSVRRLLELAAAGKVRKKIVQDPRNNNRPISLFNAADIDALARGETSTAMVLQAKAPPVPFAAMPQRAAPISDRPWLTLDEAADYSGLPASFLLGMIKRKKLPALDVGPRKGGRWRVAKRDIDAIRAPTK